MSKFKILFILLFSVITTTSFSTPTGNRESVATKKENVIIIGAGISGLAAANYLVKKNVPVLVLEARSRIGGRIHTLYAFGPAIDLGASWIHGMNNNPIADWVKQNSITTLRTEYTDSDNLNLFKSFIIYHASGHKISQNKINEIILIAEKFNNYLDHHKNQFKSLSVENAFSRFVKLENLNTQQVNFLHYIIKIVYGGEFATDLQTLSASHELAYKNSIISGDNRLFLYGYSQILPNLAKNIPIKFNQVVKKINYNSEGVDVYTNNAHYHSNYVIITVPLGVLKSGAIQFNPPLPKDKIRSIKNLGMSTYDKIYLFFDHPFWDKTSEWIGYVPAQSNQNLPVDIFNYYKFTKVPVLIFFTSGSLAKNMEQWNDAKTIKYMMAILKKIYGDKIPQPSAYIITHWYNDPFSKGSYSYLPAGVDVKSYKMLAKPVMNRLFFAGEATSSTDPATVHGAYETGIRAGKEVDKEISSRESK